MLHLLRKTRSICLVALLAILVAAGLGRHAHALNLGTGDGLAATATLDCGAKDEGDGGPGEAHGTHCALCHVAPGFLPQPGAPGAPAPRAARQPRPGRSALAEDDGPGRLARPPRGSRPA